MDASVWISEIRRAALLCKTEFVAGISNHALANQSWHRAALGDFNLWCDGLKTTNSDKSSLDYRLRERPDIREAICDLLHGLQVALHTTRHLLGDTEAKNTHLEKDTRPTEEYPDSPQSSLSWEAMSDESNNGAALLDAESSIPNLSEQISYIRTFIRQLMRVSLAIRKSGNKYRFQRIDAKCDDQMYVDFRKHLTAVMLRSIEDPEGKNLSVVQKMERTTDPARLTLIQQRLIRANILRRNRIAIMSKDDFSKNYTDPNLDISMLHSINHPGLATMADVSTIPGSTPSAVEASRKTPQKRSGQSINSSMVQTATEPGSNLDIKGILAKKALSGATKITKIGASLAYPRCPDFDLEGALICPYCGDPLPVDTSRTKLEDTWKAHIVQDLIPYTCIIEDCDCPDEMYLTAQALLAHMLDKHSVTRWTCDLCDIGETHGDEDLVQEQQLFETAEQWVAHFVTTHGETNDSTLSTAKSAGVTEPRSISASERETLAELNKRQMIGPLSCPLCEVTVAFMDTKIDDHILQHLHEFSLRALPERSGDRLEATAKTSQSINPLSHTQPQDESLTVSLEYRDITLKELERAMNEVWPLLDTNLPEPSFDWRPAGDDFPFERWQSKARPLLETLIVQKSTLLHDRNWDHSDIYNMIPKASEVIELVAELNSVRFSDDGFPEYLHFNSHAILDASSGEIVTIQWEDLTQGVVDQIEEIYQFPRSESSSQLRMALIGSKEAELRHCAASFTEYFRSQSKDNLVLWVNASNLNNLLLGFETLGTVNIYPVEGEGTRSEFWHYLNWKIDINWLLVIDELQYDTALHLSLQNRLPHGLKGTLLFTTTNESCLELFGPIKKIRVPDLNIPEEESSRLSTIEKESNIPEDKITHAETREELSERLKGNIMSENSDEKALETHEEMPTFPHSEEESLDLEDIKQPNRQYTSSLGVPAQWVNEKSHDLSVVTDAGEQLQLHPRLNLVQVDDSSGEEHDSDDALGLLSSRHLQTSKYELQEALLAVRKQNQTTRGQPKNFIPGGDLRRIINMESVTKELRKELLATHSSQRIRTYARQICKESTTGKIRDGKPRIRTFRKIFALLVLVEAVALILLFLEEDVSDQDLPLRLVRYQGKHDVYRRRDQDEMPLRCFTHDSWSPFRVENFMHYQWEMLAPFFSTDEDCTARHYVLQNEHILPFVPNDAGDENTEKVGGYARVHMVRIHPDHHNFQNEIPSERGFAIKQLYEDDREKFKKEVMALKTFSGERSHPHVVSLLATYEQSSKFHLVFPRAEGDLFDLWKDVVPRPKVTNTNVIWVLEQCMGIADALSKFHRLLRKRDVSAHKTQTESNPATTPSDSAKENTSQLEKRVHFMAPIRDSADTVPFSSSGTEREQNDIPIKSLNQPSEAYESLDAVPQSDHNELLLYGRHGDINPSNILWFDNDPEIKEALRGTLKIADFSQAEITSAYERTKARAFGQTMTYRPPESDMLPPIIGQSYDIWCLGCVYLEFVTWLLGGAKLHTEFALKRLSPDVFHYNMMSDTFFHVYLDPETQDREFRVKPTVTEFIQKDLKQHPQCSVSIIDFLTIIESGMVIVESSENQRLNAATIRLLLADLLNSCRREPSYAAGPVVHIR